MLAASDPNLIIGGFAVGGLVVAGLWRLIAWVRDAPASPDPWDAEVEQKLSEPETPEACPHCSTPQPPTAWFCAHCGRAVGPYNNLMPYLQVFSEGEVLRNGTCDRLRKSPLILIGYFLISVNFLVMGLMQWLASKPMALLILAGVFSYWLLILKNLRRPVANGAEGRPGATG
jgi:hypothetical protein